MRKEDEGFGVGLKFKRGLDVKLGVEQILIRRAITLKRLNYSLLLSDQV